MYNIFHLLLILIDIVGQKKEKKILEPYNKLDIPFFLIIVIVVVID